MPSNEIRSEKRRLFDAVLELQGQVEKLKSETEARRISQSEFESRKINLKEIVRKLSYELNYIKTQLNVKTESEKRVLDQLNLLCRHFQTKIDDYTGLATVFLSLSLDLHFEIDVDCSEYPNTPYIFIPQALLDYYEGDLLSELKLLQKWSSKKPPNIVDIFLEMERKLVELFRDRGESNLDRRDLLARRRKFIKSARLAENNGNFDTALADYRNALAISEILDDKPNYEKYKKKILEVETHINQR